MPAFGDKPICRLAREDMLSILVPIWTTKPEMARKLRQRLRIILDWAVAHGYAEQNFAGDAIRGALPSMPAVKEHHQTLHYSKIGQTIEAVNASGTGTSVKLLWRFLVLTAVRGGEARQATWAEIDCDKRLWHIPCERMKSGKPHVVPLSSPAITVLREAEPLRELGASLIFPGARRGRPLTDSTLSSAFGDTCRDGPHGTRPCSDVGDERRSSARCQGQALAPRLDQRSSVDARSEPSRAATRRSCSSGLIM